jgi:DNA-binding MarR family transcriptional regulator
MTDATASGRLLGDLLHDFIARVAHRSGSTLTIMNEASVTLPQVILLNRLAERGEATVSEIAAALGMSLPSVSQMVDRLHRLGLVTRIELFSDRRKKQIGLTTSGGVLLDRLRKARSQEFEIGTASLSAPLRADLAALLSRAIAELEPIACTSATVSPAF